MNSCSNNILFIFQTIFEIDENEQDTVTEPTNFETEYSDQDYTIPLPEFDSEQFFVENKVKEVVADVTDKIESFTETFGPGYFSSTDESVTIQPEQEEVELTTESRYVIPFKIFCASWA